MEPRVSSKREGYVPPMMLWDAPSTRPASARSLPPAKGGGCMFKMSSACHKKLSRAASRALFVPPSPNTIVVKWRARLTHATPG